MVKESRFHPTCRNPRGRPPVPMPLPLPVTPMEVLKSVMPLATAATTYATQATRTIRAIRKAGEAVKTNGRNV